MSEDMFEGVDDGDFDKGMPTEFSGVSCSGTSSSPSSQAPPTSAPRPVPPPPSPAFQSGSYQCAVCLKVLKTKKGLKSHMQRHEEYTETNVAIPNVLASAVPSTSHSTSIILHPTEGQKINQKETFTCPECPECQGILKTKHGYLRHLASHKLKGMKPNQSEFDLVKVIQEIVDEMLAEPCYGEPDNPKFKFLKEFKIKSGDQDLCGCVTDMYTVISSFVFGNQSKLLPLNQYEENTKKFNSYLNLNEDVLKKNLTQFIEIEESLAGMMVMRMGFKLNEKVHTWYFNKQKSIREEVFQEVGVRAEQEDVLRETAFAGFIGKLLRSFCQKLMATKSVSLLRVSDAASRCLRQAFVDGQAPISSRDFLNETNWFSGDEKSIVPSQHAFEFFKCVELIIPELKSRTDTQEAVEKILEDTTALDHWFHLTNQYFPTEQLAFYFMRELVSLYLKSLLLVRQQQQNRMDERSVQASTTALRTHLQHNLVEKQTLEEEDELM